MGGGKTFALAFYIIKRMLENPETLGLIAANSFLQLKNSILAELFSQLDALGLSYNYNQLTKDLTLHATGARASCLSLENYEQLRGVEYGYLAVDEMAFARPEAVNVMLGRLRCSKSNALEGRFTSTPNGYNHMYSMFGSNGYISRKKTPTHFNSKYHEMISATAYDNFFLPEDYIPSLEMQYSPLMLEQELNAEFVNLTEGLVYHAFDRNKTLKVSTDPIIDIRAGVDFNVANMSASIGSVVGIQSVHIYSEKWLENSNTFAMSDALSAVEEGMTVYPDATGAARKTSADHTDHEILRRSGLNVITRRKNPSVKDRYNNTNRWLANGWLTVDPSCKHLIEDFTKLSHDNTDDKLSHASDSLGYLLWGINPLKREARTARTINI